MAVASELAILFKGDTSGLDKATKDAEKSTGGLLDSLGKFGLAGMGVDKVKDAIGTLGDLTIGTAMKFDDAFDGIALKTGATGKALEDLQQSVKNVAGSGPEDIGKVSEVMGELAARTGQTGPGLEALTRQVLNLGQATGQDAAASVENLTRMLGDASVPAEKQAEALDLVFKASQNTGVGVDRLSQLMVSFGAPMRNLGMTMEDSAALLGRFEKEGVNTELVMGALKSASAKWAKEGLAPAEGLKQTIAKIQELGPSAAATGLAMEVFGQKAGGDMVDTILGGKFAIDDLKQSIADMPQGINEAAEGAQGFGEKMDTMKNKLLNALEPIGSMALDALGGLVDAFSPLVDTVTPIIESFASSFGDGMERAFDDGMDPLTAFISAIGSVLEDFGFKEIGAAVGEFSGALSQAFDVLTGKEESVTSYNANVKSLGDTFVAIGQGIMGVIPIVVSIGQAFMAGIGVVIPIVVPILQTLWNILSPLIPIIATLAGAFLLLSNPIGIAIVAITAIGAAAGGLGGVWDGVVSGLSNLGASIGEAWDGFLATITAALTLIGSLITVKWEEFKTTITGALQSIAETIRLQWDAFLRNIQEKLDAILAAVTTAWDAVKKSITDALDALKTAMTDAWSQLQKIVDDALAAIGKIVDTTLSTIRGVFDAQIDGIKNLVKIGLDLITGNWRGALENIFDLVWNAWNNILESVQKVLGLLPDEIAKPLQEGIERVKVWGGNVINAIADIAGTVLDGALSIGKSIVDGMKQGWDNAWAGFKAAIQGGIDALPDWIKTLLGIHSPSTVMIPIGAALPGGMEVGWRRAFDAFGATALSDVRNLWDDLITITQIAGSGLWAAGEKAGKSLMQGMAEGVKVGGKMLAAQLAEFSMSLFNPSGMAEGVNTGKKLGGLGNIGPQFNTGKAFDMKVPEARLMTPALRDLMRTTKRGKGGYVFGASQKDWGAEFWRKWHGFDTTTGGIDPSKISMAKTDWSVAPTAMADMVTKVTDSLGLLVKSFTDAGVAIGKAIAILPPPQPIEQQPPPPIPRRPHEPPIGPKKPPRPLGQGGDTLQISRLEIANQVMIDGKICGEIVTSKTFRQAVQLHYAMVPGAA